MTSRRMRRVLGLSTVRALEAAASVSIRQKAAQPDHGPAECVEDGMLARIDQHADLAADAAAELRRLLRILEIDQHRKALRAAQPVARVLDRGQRARLRGGLGADDAVGDVAD